MLIPPMFHLPNLKNIFDFGNISFGPSTLLDVPLYSSIDLTSVFLALAILGSLTLAEVTLLNVLDKCKNKQEA
jgi:hypothetical protein